MPISNYQNSNKSSKYAGFTILECILAVGILSAVLASLVGLQSSIIFVAQNSLDKLKAVWSMRQGISQLDYILDSAGFAGIPENAQFIWPGDSRFVINVSRVDLKDVKPSLFLLTAMKFYNLTNPNGNQNLNVEDSFGAIAQILDNTPLALNSSSNMNASVANRVDQSNFINVFLRVQWISGTSKNSFEDGLFLIDNKALSNMKLPNFNPKGDQPGANK